MARTPSGSSKDERSAAEASAKTVSELPDGPADATGLTPRQRRVLDVIRDSVDSRGYPPSMREIGEKVGLTSSSSVSHQLKVLEQKGLLRRDPNRPRAIEVRYPGEVADAARRSSLGSVRQTSYDETEVATRTQPRRTCRWSAGSPPVDRSWPSRTSKRSSRCLRQWLAKAPCSCCGSKVSR